MLMPMLMLIPPSTCLMLMLLAEVAEGFRPRQYLEKKQSIMRVRSHSLSPPCLLIVSFHLQKVPPAVAPLTLNGHRRAGETYFRTTSPRHVTNLIKIQLNQIEYKIGMNKYTDSFVKNCAKHMLCFTLKVLPSI